MIEYYNPEQVLEAVICFQVAAVSLITYLLKLSILDASILTKDKSKIAHEGVLYDISKYPSTQSALSSTQI